MRYSTSMARCDRVQNSHLKRSPSPALTGLQLSHILRASLRVRRIRGRSRGFWKQVPYIPEAGYVLVHLGLMMESSLSRVFAFNNGAYCSLDAGLHRLYR